MEATEMINYKVDNEVWEDIRSTLARKERSAAIQKTADFLVKKNHFLTISDKKDIIYMYDDGIYKLKGKEFIMGEIERELEGFVNTNFVKEVVDKVARKTFGDREDFEKKNKNLVMLNNCMYDLKKKQVLGFNHHIKALSKLRTNFKENAKCPKIIKFFNDVMNEEDVLFLQEILGYILLPDNRYKKAFIFTGDADTGKTTTLKLIEEFTGKINISSESLQQLCGNNFSCYNLYGKMANICDDLDFKGIRTGGMLKQLTGGSPIRGEAKFLTPFTFDNQAKIIFACNKIPPTKDINDDVYFGRYGIIRFENVIPKNKQIPNFHETLSTSKAMSGLLNWALEGLERLQKQGFSFNKTPEEVKEMMLSSGSPLYQFIKEKVKINYEEGWYVSKQKAYESFKEFCINKGYEVKSKDWFCKHFPRLCPVADVLKEIEGKKHRCWKDLSINGEIGLTDQEKQDKRRIDNGKQEDLRYR